MKEYQKKIEEYIVELMDEGKGYKPVPALREVFDKGAITSKYQGARNVLNSPKFRQAVDPSGDGYYSKKEASKNLSKGIAPKFTGSPFLPFKILVASSNSST